MCRHAAANRGAGFPVWQGGLVAAYGGRDTVMALSGLGASNAVISMIATTTESSRECDQNFWML